MFVVNFDALAQASDIWIERRQVVFLCWMQDSDPGSQTPNRQQTEYPLTNRLSYRGSSKNLHSTLLPVGFRTWLWRYACLLLLISMLLHRQAIFCGEYGWVLWACWPRREPRYAGNRHWPVTVHQPSLKTSQRGKCSVEPSSVFQLLSPGKVPKPP